MPAQDDQRLLGLARDGSMATPVPHLCLVSYNILDYMRFGRGLMQLQLAGGAWQCGHMSRSVKVELATLSPTIDCTIVVWNLGRQ